MTLGISLLGRPHVERGGERLTSPRGVKVWALLTYLIRSEVPPSRQQLVGLLFPEADDPLGALRWNLSRLRRLLGPEASLSGDPIRLALPKQTFVDVDVLIRGSWVEALRLPGFGLGLIEGIELTASPGFDLWLENERRHLMGLSAAVLHEAAHANLAKGAFDEAADLATRLVALDPYDENSQVLLVRCLRAADRPDAAAQQIAACSALFREELGTEPSPALRAAAAPIDTRADGHISARGAILAKLEAGEAAVAAGALWAGLEALREAAVAARLGTDRHLHARIMTSLGSALVHAARGSDEEGAAALYEASTVAEEIGDPVLAATALREIGWVELLRARYERAEAVLSRAAALAEGNDPESAWISCVLGACRTDTADYPGAIEALTRGIQVADRAHDAHAGAFARTFLGRAKLLRGELQGASDLLDAALDLARGENWTSFIPLPEALRAEADLMNGNVEGASERFEHAFALGCQLGDPCWESIAARGLGLVSEANGELDRAIELLDEAPRRCRRLPDSYLWIEAYAIEALCSVGVAHGLLSASRWIGEFESFSSKNGMRELVARAAILRARLGEEGASDAARALAQGIDNPQLTELLAQVGV